MFNILSTLAELAGFPKYLLARLANKGKFK